MAWVDIENSEIGFSVRAKLNALGQGPGSGLFEDGSEATPSVAFITDPDTGIFKPAANVLASATGGVERWRTDASGNFSIGVENTTFPLHVLRANPFWEMACFQNNAPGAGANITLVNGSGHTWDFGLRGDSETFAIRRTAGGITLNIVFADAAQFSPGFDNSATLGGASNRWAVVYSGTGTINTSDERDKVWRGELNADELSAAKRIAAEIGIYQWREAVDEKGADKARLHTGVRAQRVFAILEEEGLDWRRFAWCCYDQWDEQTEPVTSEDGALTGETHVTLEAGDRYGIRPDQLLFWLIAAQEQRLLALEG